MPPLVMPWLMRKASSVCTSTSKIALPIPRTSYFAAVIWESCCGNGLRMRPIMIGLAPASIAAAIDVQDDPLLRHGIHGNAGLAAARLRARFHDRGIARRRPGGGCVPRGVSAGQCGQAIAD